MGWTSIFGAENPLAQYAQQNRNTLGALGAGIASGQNFSDGLATGVQSIPAGQRADDAYATAQKAEAERLRGIQTTSDFLRRMGYNDLLAGLEGGALTASTAFEGGLKRSSPEPQDPFTLGAGEVRYGPNGEMIAQGPAKGMGDGPASYQEFLLGQQNPEYAASLAAKNAATNKPTESRIRNQMLSKVIQPEAASLLGDPATGAGGTFDALADTGNQFWNGVGLGSAATSPEYQRAQNSLKTIIASYLYATSGATANPGEVENQAAILTPKPGENAQSVAAKKARLAQMVQAVDEAANGDQVATPGAATGGADDPLGLR